jgi:hypothetical protein
MIYPPGFRKRRRKMIKTAQNEELGSSNLTDEVFILASELLRDLPLPGTNPAATSLSHEVKNAGSQRGRREPECLSIHLSRLLLLCSGGKGSEAEVAQNSAAAVGAKDDVGGFDIVVKDAFSMGAGDGVADIGPDAKMSAFGHGGYQVVIDKFFDTNSI